MTQQDLINFIWAIANLLRGPYRPPQYRRVMLPMTVLRRLDCVLEPSKDAVLAEHVRNKDQAPETIEKIIKRKFKLPFYNFSKLTFRKLLDDPDKLAQNLVHYLKGFSPSAQKILSHFEFDKEIEKLDQANRLFEVVKAFADADLQPAHVPDMAMGYAFEDLVRRFNEQANEEAGDHFTPREVIRLMVHILFQPDDKTLVEPGLVRTIYDPACGTGGMLSIAERYIKTDAPGLQFTMFGQEYNPESYAICGSDLMIKGEETTHIVFDDTLTDDGHKGRHFDYMLCNPPFGVEWKAQKDKVEAEHADHGFNGRFGAGLPRINDGSLLFLQHMIAKMKPAKEGGSRISIVFNGSPLFTGDAGSGESEIRRWIIENDWLDAIIALPDQLFYNTGIYTYVWVVTNRKSPRRQGKVQLINAVDMFQKMRKSLGNKRNELSEAQIGEITRIYGNNVDGKRSKIFRNQDFGYIKLTIERPLRLNFQASPERIQRLWEQSAFVALAESKKRKDKKAAAADTQSGEVQQSAIVEALAKLGSKLYKDRAQFAPLLDGVMEKLGFRVLAPVRKAILAALAERDETAEICRVDDAPKGAPEPDAELRDTESVPLPADIHLPLPLNYGDGADNTALVKLVRKHCDAYFDREVRPHVADAWIDYAKTKAGFEIPFTHHFYEYQPPRPLEEIEADIKTLEGDILKLLQGVTEGSA